jgi:hypothetical protein
VCREFASIETLQVAGADTSRLELRARPGCCSGFLHSGVTIAWWRDLLE